LLPEKSDSESNRQDSFLSPETAKFLSKFTAEVVRYEWKLINRMSYTSPSPIVLDNIDVFLVTVSTLVSFVLRFWHLSLPDAVVFDEVYFGNFLNY
jgi:hypothetical protein